MQVCIPFHCISIQGYIQIAWKSEQGLFQNHIFNQHHGNFFKYFFQIKKKLKKISETLKNEISFSHEYTSQIHTNTDNLGTGNTLYMLFILHAHYRCQRELTQFSIPQSSTSDTFKNIFKYTYIVNEIWYEIVIFTISIQIHICRINV